MEKPTSAEKKIVNTNRRYQCKINVSCETGADPGFLPGEGAKGMMTLYGMGMSEFVKYTNTDLQIFKMFIAILCLNGVEQPFKRHQCPFFCP